MTLRIGSLFSGAGGLDLAVESVFGGKVAWQAEIDPAASKVLAYRFPGVPNLGDVTTVDWTLVAWVAVLCLGFPCQDVSAAGRRAGIAEGTRSGLWSVAVEVIAAIRPAFVVIENVRGLLSAKAHRAMESDDATVGDGPDGPVLRAAGAVCGDLADLGYDAQWITVAASDVGSCHERKRVIFLATDTTRDGRHEGWPESARIVGRPDAAVGGDGDVADAEGCRRSCVDGGPCSSEACGGRERIAGGSARRGAVSVDLLPTPRARDHKGAANPPGRMRDGRARTAGDNALPDTVCDLLPTPAAADAGRGPDFARAGREGSGGDDLVTLCARATREIGTRWGKYEPAIRRWESVTRPAPSPTEPNSKGNPRLSPKFSEWMQGWADGWATDVPGLSRNDQLRIIGNGVCPQQAEYALHQLIPLASVDPSTAPVCWCCEKSGPCDCDALVAAELAASEGNTAVISECGRYRYELRRVWDPAGPLLEFIMLNPSTADASVDDPTIRRCIGFAKAWGYGGIVVHNLYALRATNPEVLLNYSGDSYGPRNDEFLGRDVADCTIVAWGAHAATLSPKAVARIRIVAQLCRPRLFCLGTNANGSPKHPLYVPADRTPVRWDAP